MDGLTSTGRISADRAQSACSRILAAGGASTADAEIVARSLTRAELRGQSSHGFMRLETYVRRLQAGLIRSGRAPEIIAGTSATVVLDAHAGFGHAAGWFAMGEAIERARSIGVGLAVVRNSTHFGIAGFFAMRASSERMIGVVASNGAARMAPVGTKTAVLGTNPLAIAIPTGEAMPILLDMSTSTAALGRIMAARDRGEMLPDGWALDNEGVPTNLPEEALSGLLTPLGGHKGFGLALVLELLSAGLSGAPVGKGAGSMYRTWDRPEELGHFFLAISVEAIVQLDSFAARVGDLIAQVRSAEPTAEGVRPMLPGEPEWLRELECRKKGIPLSNELQASFARAASLAGVEITL